MVLDKHCHWYVKDYIVFFEPQIVRILSPSKVKAVSDNLVHVSRETDFESALVLGGRDDQASAIGANLDPHCVLDDDSVADSHLVGAVFVPIGAYHFNVVNDALSDLLRSTVPHALSCDELLVVCLVWGDFGR